MGTACDSHWRNEYCTYSFGSKTEENSFGRQRKKCEHNIQRHLTEIKWEMYSGFSWFSWGTQSFEHVDVRLNQYTFEVLLTTRVPESQSVVRHVVCIWLTYTAFPVDAVGLSLTSLDVGRCDLIGELPPHTISPVHRTVSWQPYEHFRCYWKPDLFHFPFQRLHTGVSARILMYEVFCVCDLNMIKQCRLPPNILQNTLSFTYVTIACKKRRRRRTSICLISTPNTFRWVSFLSWKHKPLISFD
jgi:hypothetical protein